MKRKPEEIIAFAEKHVEARRQVRWLIPMIGLAILVSAFWLVKWLFEKESRFGESLVSNEQFVLGFAFAMLFMLTIVLGAAMLATLVRTLQGIQTDALDLLLKLWKEKHGQQNGGG